ncbi:hypothetical protein J7T55_007543 [Diaporthe amygdali]|uniref:uncharacterized protein n=1 Tax=Phomopsis amygdali TaxID=1214568 RepID=UPI0022FDBAEF|nr:uncharacterized protein J7T55_007543 [Diaporthe amygdali]KAJ0116563.1 hypothetical protein J7T55_007543 [Diaporthe amygdali]
MSNLNQKGPAGEQWDEAEIEQALKRLGDLHHQANAQPEIDRFQDNGAPVYPLFIGEIREYKQAATSEETVKVLEHANQSRKENPKGIKPWRARDDPNWLTTNG